MKIQYLTFELGVKVIRNVSQCPLHHVTYYSATQFEVPASNSLGDKFTKTKSLFDL